MLAAFAIKFPWAGSKEIAHAVITDKDIFRRENISIKGVGRRLIPACGARGAGDGFVVNEVRYRIVLSGVGADRRWIADDLEQGMHGLMSPAQVSGIAASPPSAICLPSWRRCNPPLSRCKFSVPQSTAGMPRLLEFQNVVHCRPQGRQNEP